MSKYFSFCNQSAKTKKATLKGGKKTNIKDTMHILNLYSRSLIIFVLLAVAGLYVFLVNTGTTKGFEISNLEEQIKIAQEKNSELAEQVGSLKSLTLVEERINSSEMVAVSEIEYLKPSGVVAVAK